MLYDFKRRCAITQPEFEFKYMELSYREWPVFQYTHDLEEVPGGLSHRKENQHCRSFNL